MKLVVLGAAGGIGLEIVRQGLEQGHTVTAFVRSPERLKPFQGRIAVKQGDVLNSVELERPSKVTTQCSQGSVRGSLFRKVTRTFYGTSPLP